LTAVDIQKRLLLIFGTMVCFFVVTNVIVSKHFMDGSARERVGPQIKSLRVQSPSVLFELPKGEAVALPSLRVQENINRKSSGVVYGGEGDAKHLGGFTDIDVHGISPAVWKHMISYFGVKSILDVGCGRGISTSWFDLHGVDTICVEGSHDAIVKTMIPNANPSKLIEHDFSRGPWWPARTVDAVWCVEFLEHVGRNYHKNYIPTFRKAALIFASHSHWGGWHHVEVHDDVWWLNKMESYGFKFSQTLTDMVRSIAKKELADNIMSPTGKNFNAQHIWLTMQVFINPLVAVLPEHEHLFAEHGCGKKGDPKECEEGGVVTPLPKEFYPLALTPEMDDKWDSLVKSNVKNTSTTT